MTEELAYRIWEKEGRPDGEKLEKCIFCGKEFKVKERHWYLADISECFMSDEPCPDREKEQTMERLKAIDIKCTCGRKIEVESVDLDKDEMVLKPCKCLSSKAFLEEAWKLEEEYGCDIVGKILEHKHGKEKR